MSWFSSRGASSGKEQASRVQTLAEPDVHRSLALAALFDEIRGRKVQVLDLGPAVGSNVEFLSQFGCKLYIEDLYAALSSRTALGEGELSGPAFFAEFLAVPEETRFDVIFAWDLFNYLQRKELVHFAALLRRHCDRGARLFALMSILKTMPAQPYRFKIQDEQTLIYERRTAAERPSPRYVPSEITDAFKGFRVDRSFLLRHGIQEFLLAKD
ncbi:MAG TPA: hypothetical protein VF173_09045 [Thermoanaerobaculia bacterium]|nr:hypothetical protein [Thermoanaerobaculia bacterium]